MNEDFRVRVIVESVNRDSRFKNYASSMEYDGDVTALTPHVVIDNATEVVRHTIYEYLRHNGYIPPNTTVRRLSVEEQYKRQTGG